MPSPANTLSSTALNPTERALLSLQGLSVGDAFGEAFFLPDAQALARISRGTLPPAPWSFTDDTMMAISVVATLKRSGRIDPEDLVRDFIARYRPHRGYGPSMHGYLTSLASRGPELWQSASQALFAGQGSFGNGAAMRVAPLGAFFAEDPVLLIEQARRSAIATHSHPDAVDGAIAVALAAAAAWNTRSAVAPTPSHLLTSVAAGLQPGPLRQALERAAGLPPNTSPQAAALALGNGSQSSALDTVPFSLWSAARHLASFEDALWATVSVLGDRDTTCAIVGGIVALRTGIAGIPQPWLERAENPMPPLENPHRPHRPG